MPASVSAMSCATSQTEGADQMKRRRRRIGQRPQDVEDRAHAERRAHGRDRLHRRVIMRREQEGEVGRGQTVAAPLLIQRHLQAERFEHIGAAGAAGDGAIAVFEHRHAAGGRQQRGARRDVEAAGSVAAGPHDIDCRAARRECAACAPAGACRGQSRALRPRRRLCCAEPPAARPPSPASLSGSVSCVSSSSASDSRRSRRSSSRSRVSRRDGIAALRREPCALARSAVKPQEILHQRGPSGVRMLSGWNCTPSTIKRRWRTPMISPSGVRAVTSSSGGRVSGAAISE